MRARQAARDQPCVRSVPSAPRAEDLLGSGVSAAPPPGWEAGATRTLSTLGRAGLQGCGRWGGDSSATLASPDTFSHIQGYGQTGHWRLKPALTQSAGFWYPELRGAWHWDFLCVCVGGKLPGSVRKSSVRKRPPPEDVCLSQCGTGNCPTLPSSQPRWEALWASQ